MHMCCRICRRVKLGSTQPPLLKPPTQPTHTTWPHAACAHRREPRRRRRSRWRWPWTGRQRTQRPGRRRRWSARWQWPGRQPVVGWGRGRGGVHRGWARQITTGARDVWQHGCCRGMLVQQAQQASPPPPPPATTCFPIAAHQERACGATPRPHRDRPLQQQQRPPWRCRRPRRRRWRRPGPGRPRWRPSRPGRRRWRGPGRRRWRCCRPTRWPRQRRWRRPVWGVRE